MSREDRDIVLDGQMPVSLAGIISEDLAMDFLNPRMWVEVVEYRDQNESIRKVIEACEAEFEQFDYLPAEGDSFDDVWAALAAFRQSGRHRRAMSREDRDIVIEYDRALAAETAVQEGRAELDRQERNRFRMHRDVDQLVSGLRGCNLPQSVIINVLHGDPDAINVAASAIRSVSRDRESAGFAPPNSHSELLQLLRRSGVPGSEEAQQFLQGWTQSTDREQPDRAELAEAADDLIQRAQAGERVSTSVILERLGVMAPPSTAPPGITRLGQAVDLPASDGQRRLRQDQSSDQMVVKSAFKDSLLAFMRAYSGDLTYVVSAFARYMVDYGSAVTTRGRDDLGQTLARGLLEAAAEVSSVPIDTLIPSRLRSGGSGTAEQGNENAGQEENTPAHQLGEPSSPGDVLGRDSGEPDDPAAAAPTIPRIIRI